MSAIQSETHAAPIRLPSTVQTLAIGWGATPAIICQVQDALPRRQQDTNSELAAHTRWVTDRTRGLREDT